MFRYRCAILPLRYPGGQRADKNPGRSSAQAAKNCRFFHLRRFLGMETIAQRATQPDVFEAGAQALKHDEQRFCLEEDRAAAPIRNDLSDLRHITAWCESTWKQGRAENFVFTPTRTSDRTSLKTLQLKPKSTNRSLLRLKRSFAWLIATQHLPYDPAGDQEEQTLVVTEKNKGTTQDQAILVLIVHTGLCARDVCTHTRPQVRPGTKSGSLPASGKTTARKARFATRPPTQDPTPLFRSEKKRPARLPELEKYAEQARLCDISPHDPGHRVGYRMARTVPLHRRAQLMGHSSLDTTLLYVHGIQQDVEKITWT